MAPSHDTGYKRLFSHPEMVRDLLLGFVPQAWVQHADFSTLSPVPGSYVTEDLKSRHDDLVWRVRLKDRWLYVYLLLEFQSRPDPWMALRILVYVGLLYQDLVNRNEWAPDGKLPPVLPIVLYNGHPRWQAAEALSDLITPPPDGLAPYQPQARYLLLDEGRIHPDQLQLQNLVAALFRLETGRGLDDLESVVNRLIDWLSEPGQQPIRRSFAVWIRHLLREQFPGASIPNVTDLGEVKAMLAENLNNWFADQKQAALAQGVRQGMQEGMQRGMQQGMQQGESQALHRLLTRRFGPVPADLGERIRTAALDDLDRWFDRAIDAPSLAAVFTDQSN
jgi:hypothetical protein